MQIVAPSFARLRARNGLFVPNMPFLAQILTIAGDSLARRDGIDLGGPKALGEVRSIDSRLGSAG